MPAGAFNTFSDRAEYDAAMAEWQRKKAAGDPFPGPMPRLDEALGNEQRLQNAGYPASLPNYDLYAGLARAGVGAPDRANPYSTTVANQARPAQEALLAQMRASLGGPSLAEMQGARAQGQNLQAALGAGAGRGAMLQARGIGAGLAGDTGAARLAEQMRLSQGYGGAVGGMRGADLGVSQQQAQAGLQTRGLDDAMRQFYGSQGAAYENAGGKFGAELEKLKKRLELQGRQNALDASSSSANMLASAFGGGL